MCDRIVLPYGKIICPPCEPKLKTIKDPYCLKCGKPLSNEGKSLCDRCSIAPHDFDECRSALLYDDTMRRSIYRFKYDGRKEYAVYFGQKMAEVLGEKIKTLHADAIIPVPMYKGKEKKRGFNQASLLARELSYHLNIPVYENIIIREKSTKIMRSLGARERENNLKKAFKMVPNSVKLYDVIIVDDIYTTGSTADAVAKVMRESGVRRVFVASLSTGKIESQMED